MSKKSGQPIIVTINGIDVSKHILNICLPMPGEELFEGVETLGPFVLQGRFDDGTKDCVICGSQFTPGPEGILAITVVDTGERFTPVCHACGTSLMSPSD